MLAVLVVLSCLLASQAPAAVRAADRPMVAAIARPRLVGGTAYWNGRLEVQMGGRWGAICIAGFDATAAQVACRELGLAGGQVARFPRGAVPYMLTNLKCEASAGSLAACRFTLTSACPQGSAAGVICANPPVDTVTLVGTYFGGSPFPGSPVPAPGLSPIPGGSPIPPGPGPIYTAGRLEVFSGGRWGTVCDRGFGDEEAQVVCRMLGKAGGRALPNAAYGRGAYPPMLDYVACKGNEVSLTGCKYSVRSTCTHDHDVSVECIEPYEMKVRLVGGPNPTQGRLEVEIGGSWGSVCDSGTTGRRFNHAAAQVVCRKLGFNGGWAKYGAPYGPSQLPILMSNVTCTGMENELSACQFSTVAAGCTHARDVGVVCDKPSIGRVYMPRSGDGQPSGFPLVEFGATSPSQGPSTSLICRDGVTNREATVLCKTLDQGSGVLLSPTVPLPIEVSGYPMVLTNLVCPANESSVYGCQWTYSGNCPSGKAMGVYCKPPPIASSRLANGNATAGVLEVSFDYPWGEQWGKICNKGFGAAEAAAACRGLGFPKGGRVAPSGAFPDSMFSYIFGNVACAPAAKNLSQCTGYKEDYCPVDFSGGSYNFPQPAAVICNA